MDVETARLDLSIYTSKTVLFDVVENPRWGTTKGFENNIIYNYINIVFYLI